MRLDRAATSLYASVPTRVKIGERFFEIFFRKVFRKSLPKTWRTSPVSRNVRRVNDFQATTDREVWGKHV
jgi:hypothetical protein